MSSSSEIRDLINLTDRFANDFHRDVIVTAWKEIVSRTRKRSGRLRWNWFVSIGGPGNYAAGVGEYGEPGLQRTLDSLASLKLADNAFITNNTPYVELQDKQYEMVERGLDAVEVV